MMIFNRKFAFRAAALFLAVILMWPLRGDAQGKISVDLVLIIAVDCSYSVDSSEFYLQMQGTAAAFRRREIIDAITSGPTGRIAVAVMQWSSAESQKIVVPWRLIGGQGSALSLANEISKAPRRTSDGGTSIAAAIDAGAFLLARSPFSAPRYVIDISSDGTNNGGGRVERSRDQAAAAGITVNGLTILNEVSYLHYYFQNRVIGGPGNFVIISNDYTAYAKAIRRKLLLEILGPVA